MKKGKILILGMLVVALPLGLVFTGCGDGTGNEPPKTIKVTGFDYPDEVIEHWMDIFSEWNPEEWSPVAGAAGDVDGQTIIYPVWYWDTLEFWTGYGNFYIVISFSLSEDGGKQYVYSLDGKNPGIFNIKNEVTSLKWSDFIWINDFSFD